MSSPSLTISVNTYSYIYSHHAFEAARHLRTIGFENFEFLFNSPHIWISEIPKECRKSKPTIISDEKLRITSFNLPIMDHNITSPNPDTRNFTQQRFKELIELAGFWSVPYVVVVPGKVSPLFPAPKQLMLEWLLEGIFILAEHAKEAGTKVLIENVPITTAPLAKDLLNILDKINHPNVGIVYDVANGYYAGQDPAEELLQLEGVLDLIHLSDTGRNEWRHDPIGAGGIDFASVHGALGKIAFDGLSVMEIISPNPDYDLVESWERLANLGWKGRVL